MARKTDKATPTRFDTLHELLTRAEALGGTVQLSIHDVPVPDALEWLQLGLLDRIEEGAGGTNPPTGIMEHWDGERHQAATVFTKAPALTIEEREAAIGRVAEELRTNTMLLDELKRSESEKAAEKAAKEAQ